jgi:hypothetical protein
MTSYLKSTRPKASTWKKTSSVSSGVRDGREDDESLNDEEDGLTFNLSSSKDGTSEGIAQRETKMVNCSKATVIMVVSMLAAATGLFAYFYLSAQEHTKYRTSVSETTILRLRRMLTKRQTKVG